MGFCQSLQVFASRLNFFAARFQIGSDGVEGVAEILLVHGKAQQTPRARKPLQCFYPLLEADYGTLEGITENLFKKHFPPSEVAAIFVESIQGEGGYHIPPKEFLPALRDLCSEQGILMVIDEIQSGIGRTGKWWACEHDDVVPDVICSAKGLASGMPLGALITKASVMVWPPGAQGSTYGGNPVCCAASLATLNLVEGGFMANAAKLGATTLSRLGEMESRHKCLANIRGRGLMIGFDIVRGPNKGTEFAVRGDFVQIGRDPEMGVPLEDEEVSRRHAVIVRHRDRYFLRDCGSTNGTYLKGLFHGSERELSPGDRFRIGETEFVFRMGKA